MLFRSLLERKTTGKGAYVTTSLLESAVASLANQATNWLMEAHIPERMGSMHPNITPYGDVFYSSDKKPIVLAIGTERQFLNLCKVLNINDLVNDIRFSKNAERVKNRIELRDFLQNAFLNFEQKYLLETFKVQGVPAGKIRNMKEVFEQPKAQNMILEETMEDGTVSRRVKTVAFEIR